MTLNCNGSLIDLSEPKVMGILNRTPDSFFDGGRLVDDRSVLLKAEELIKEGATFVDVGGYSTRPDAGDVSEDEELHRVISTISLLTKNFPKLLLSVDSFRSRVAKEGVAAGACMINDVSGGTLDREMLQTVADCQVPYVMMHMRGNPTTMKNLNQYENVTQDVVFELSKHLAKARELGINDVIIDPGFGFAKNIQQNFEMLQHLEHFQHLDCPLLIGISRKSMIYKTLGISPEEALNGTTALHAIALVKGAHILRVHDVKEAMECIHLLKNFKN